MIGWNDRKPEEVRNFWRGIEHAPVDATYRHPACTLCGPDALTPSGNKCVCTGVTQVVEFLTGHKHWCIPPFFWNWHGYLQLVAPDGTVTYVPAPNAVDPFREFHATLCFNRFAHAPRQHPDAPTSVDYQAYWEALGPDAALRREHPIELAGQHIYDSLKESELSGLDRVAVERVLTFRLIARALMSLREEIPTRYRSETERLAGKFGG